MTSRTTPVGLLVVALASLVATGCSASTNAVFEALLEPLGAQASPTEAVTDPADASTGSDEATWWPLPDGYAMVLPPGWSGVALSDTQVNQLVDAVGADHPDLVGRIDDVLEVTDSRVSAIAGDPEAAGDLAPLLVILTQPIGDRPAHAVKAQVKEQIAGLPGLSGGPFRADVSLPTVNGVRFDFSLDDPDLGSIQVRSYLVRFAGDAYLVCFVAAADDFEDAEATFESIVSSLRFGV
jgi:hypothetical protein